MQVTQLEVQQCLARAQDAMALGQWRPALDGFARAIHWLPQSAQVQHNLALCQLALGLHEAALQSSKRALALMPSLWQSHMLKGNALKALMQPEAADDAFLQVLAKHPENGEALLARADLAMNVFGLPLQAVQGVKPLLQVPEHAADAQLTTLMASVYDRDCSALTLSKAVMAFSQQNLRLAETLQQPQAVQRRQLKSGSKRLRPRVALLSPLFCASPVYFLTIAGWRHVAKGSDIVVFNRGHKSDWATDQFRDLSTEWHDVQQLPAEALAQRIQAADIDVLYDLGGWMDPVGLKALSVKPAREMYKWVGGQSLTTGLESFDGWIGDEWQSPLTLQHLYSERLVNIPGGYATYTPPPYLPSVPIHKRSVAVIFSNPAKLSRAFLAWLAKLPGPKLFVHHQFRYERARQKVIRALGSAGVEFICPSSHTEALQVLGRYEWMVDTFPYSSGLTAREAVAMGMKVKSFSGELFCERHSLVLGS
jgi:predicted O-linked N-acetylglucosamine transferase (SPINDLY family)